VNHKANLEKVVSLSATLRGFRIVRFFGERFTSRQYAPPGLDSSPPANSSPLVDAVGGDTSYLATYAFLDKIEKLAEQGETRIYSTEDGETVAAFVFLKKDGKIQMNGTDYGGLIKIAELEAKLNALIAELNAHTHATFPVDSGPFTAFARTDFENTEIEHG